MSPAGPRIRLDRCSGCGRCVAACTHRNISLETYGHRKFAVIRQTVLCTACGSCSESCLLEALTIPGEERP